MDHPWSLFLLNSRPFLNDDVNTLTGRNRFKELLKMFEPLCKDDTRLQVMNYVHRVYFF